MMAPSDSVEGEFIAEFIAAQLGARTASIFCITEEYGAGVRAAVRAGLDARGVRTIDEVPIRLDGSCAPESEHNAYGEVVDASLNRQRPEAVVVAGRVRETACIARRVHELAPGTPVVAGAALRTVGPDPHRIRDYLTDLGDGRPAWAGVTGPASFGAGRRYGLLMTQWSDEQITIVFRSPT